MKPELVTAYYLCHGHSTVIPHQVQEDFEEMRACGFGAVAISFSEDEMSYGRRAFEIQVRLAHAAGLKMFVIPSRIGGRFAGAPLMPSLWLSNHPEAVAEGAGEFLPVAAIESKLFVEWVRGFMATLVSDYELDGIVWDEPKCVSAISHHPDTLAALGPDPTPLDMEASFIRFLSDLTDHCLALRPGMTVTLFARALDSTSFTSAAARIRALRYFGYDGNLARSSYFHEEPKWIKYRIESVWERTQQECAAAGKGAFALVENMLMPAAAIPEYEQNLDAYLAGPLPDHLALYYYAHNNEDPERVHAITRRLMLKHLR